ncbi:ABC transporter substrate-binding protein [Pseudonocardia acaciae]|uniref:ABC transporter substrate-binding protein n=1 Tax=Pseudonocardia acaciae TaxID=551276 RepID=UPI000563CCA6|nr:ABC transporter substrate-binding protein [Pseudonocardia acaciae]
MTRSAPASALAAVVLALVLTLAGCASGPSGPGKGKPVTLMLNFYPYGDHAPLYYGLKHGIFANHGIDLKIVPGKGSVATGQAVAAGNADFGWVDTPALLSSVQSGVAIKSIGVFEQTTPSAVQFLADSGITRPQDLRGRTIALTPGDPYSDAFPGFLRANGMSVDDVKTVNVQAADKIATVISGRADALCGFISDQGPTIEAKTGKKVGYLKFADHGMPYLGTGLVVSDRNLAADPALSAAMWKATSESFEAAVAQPAEAVAAMKGASPALPPHEVLTEQWKRAASVMSTPATAGRPPGTNAESDWTTTIKTFHDLRVLTTAQPAATYWRSVAP